VAEAMDTAQRGMGLYWDQAKDLIRYSAERAGDARRTGGAGHTGGTGGTERRGGLIACGAGTDQLPAGEAHTLTAIARAYDEQLELVQSSGARVILMASRAMAATTWTSTVTCSSRPTSRSSCTGWARHSTRSCAATGAAPISMRPPTLSSS
jgi:hypothetical protein